MQRINELTQKEIAYVSGGINEAAYGAASTVVGLGIGTYLAYTARSINLHLSVFGMNVQRKVNTPFMAQAGIMLLTSVLVHRLSDAILKPVVNEMSSMASEFMQLFKKDV